MAQANKEYLFSSHSNPSGTAAEQELSAVLVETLADRMSEKPPSPSSTLSMLADITECVAALNEGGAKHTELSPATILFTREGKVSIRSYTLGQTEGTIAFANPKYVSPDAFRKGVADRDATLRDVYILGFIFYEFFLGKALFQEQFSDIHSPAGWIAWHTSETSQPKPLTELLPGFPLAIAQIVEGMLEKDPAKRAKDPVKVAYRLRSATERTVVYEEPHKSASPLNNATNTSEPETGTDILQLGQEAGVKVSDFTRKTYAICRQLSDQILKRIRVKSPGAAPTVPRIDTRRLFQPISNISVGRPSMVGGLVVGLAVLAVWLWRFGSGSSPSPASAAPMGIETDSGEMVRVEAREVAVGASAVNPNDSRKRTAYRESFYIDRFEVSNSSFKRFCLTTGRTCPDFLLGPEYTKHADDPVLDVSVDDARAYAEWAGKWLPSVAEWRDAMLSERGWMGIRPGRPAMSEDRLVLEWTDSDFRNSFVKADAGVKVLKADLATNQLTLLRANGSLNQSGVGFRCVSGAHILETPHFLGEFKLPAGQHTAPSSAPAADQPTSVAVTPQRQPAAPGPDTKSYIRPDTVAVPPDSSTRHPGELQQSVDEHASISTDNNALTAVPDRISFTVTANVRDAAVLINEEPTKLSLVNGSRRLSLPPGKYQVSVTREMYETPPTQQIELRAGDTRAQALVFSLSFIRRNAILAVNSALAGAEVFVDNDHIGTIGPSGALTADVPPGNHAVVLRKQNYEALNRSFEFSAGKTIALSGADMKPFGALVPKVSPANAHITLHRNGDSQELVVPNATTYATPPGDYVISAGADRRTTRREAVTIAPGQTLNIGWELSVAPAVIPATRTPRSLFESSIAWRVDPSGWWVHDGKGYTFLRATEGTFAWEIRRDTPKGGIFRSKSKRVTFVAEYKSEDDRIVYTLDPHYLIKRVYSGSKLREERKSEIADGAFFLLVQLTPHTVLLQSSAGEVLDSIPRTGEPGKFGFLDEVWLTAQ
jgi:hypothetical protein